jgi:PAS domain S-box-containing protein
MTKGVGLGARRPFSIIAGLRLYLFLIVAAVSVIASALVLVNEAAKTKGDFEAKADTYVRYFNSILELPLWDLDTATVATLGDALFRDEDIASLRITGIHGRVFYDKSRPAKANIARAVAIRHEGEEIGQAEVVLTYRNANARVLDFLAKMVAVMIAIVVITIFLAGLLIRVVLRDPLDYLTRIVSSYAEGRYPAETGDFPIVEFKAFDEVLEGMASRILGQLSDMRELNVELEESTHEKDELILELRASEAKFKSLFDSSPAALAIADLEDELFVDVNASLLDLLGYAQGELIGRSTRELGLYAEATEREEIFASIKAGEAVTDKEVRFIARDSRVVPVRFSARAIDIGGRPCLLSLLVDMTERKRNEARLEESLAEKNALLRELYHRTKNNMQVICSMLNMKSEQLSDERTKSAFEDIANRIYSMALVHEMLYESHSLSCIDLGKYLADLLTLLTKSQAGTSREVIFELKLPALNVSIDEAIPVGLIVTELITNALRHAFAGQPRGVIKVCLSSSGPSVLLEVSDDGVGLPPLFDWRSSKSMGFKIISALADQLGGAVEFVSEKGTTCRITFSASQAPSLSFKAS